MAETIQLTHTLDDYKSDEKPTWCPGCGDFGVLNALYNAMRAKDYDPKDVVLVSGIGCSSRLPFFVSTYGFHGVHGRAPGGGPPPAGGPSAPPPRGRGGGPRGGPRPPGGGGGGGAGGAGGRGF